MRRAIRTPLAVVFALLVVTAGALGAVTFVNPNVDTLDEASHQLVGESEGAALLVGAAVGFAVGAMAYDHFVGSRPDVEALEGADAAETKKAIYDQLSIQGQNDENTITSYENYLQDTQSVALMEGKNAYIRALENGSTESVANNKATEAVADYYATKQKNLIAHWNTAVLTGRSAENVAENTSGVSADFVTTTVSMENYYVGGAHYEGGNRSVTLLNQSSATVERVHVDVESSGTYSYSGNHDFISRSAGSYDTLTGLKVKAPNDNYDPIVYTDATKLNSLWSEIDSQNTQAQNELDTFINNTYDSYQQGDINTSDLVDPYLGAREYSPETSNTWALRTLTSIGADSPMNLSSIGHMNVTSDGDQLQGVLMSSETPEGGFVVNQTYNTTALNGSQWVATLDGETQRLDGDFTITSAETTDGEAYANGEAIEYRNVDYQTANTQEFKALQQQLDQLTAQINARQQNLRNSGGTGWLPQGMNLGQIAPIALIIGGALVLLGRN